MYIGLSCEVSNGGCEHICTNTENGATCSCNDGYQLTGNYRNCTGTFALIVQIPNVFDMGLNQG